MATGYSRINSFQAPWGTLSPDPTVIDGNPATGAFSAFSPPNDITAGVDYGATVVITDISLRVGWTTNLVYVLEWSIDSTTWHTTGLSLPATGSHSGVFSLETITLSGLSISARYLRLSIDEAAGPAEVTEIDATLAIPDGQPDILYAMLSQVTGSQGAINLFSAGGGVVNAVRGAGSTCITFDNGSRDTFSEICGRIGYSHTASEVWEYSANGVVWTTFTPSAAASYPAGGGIYTQVEQVWTISPSILARFLRYTITDTPVGSLVATPAVGTMAPNDPNASGGSLSLSGTVTRSNGSPWASSHVSIVYKTGTGFSVRICHRLNPFTNGQYCADGDMQVDVVTTDCSGNWSWSGASDVRNVAVCLGPMRINPNFDPEDEHGKSADGMFNHWYIIPDTTVAGWSCAAGFSATIDADSSHIDGTASGTLTAYGPGGSPETGATDSSRRFNGGQQSGYASCCGFGCDNNGAQQPAGLLLFRLSGNYAGICNTFNFLTGAHTLDFVVQEQGAEVWFIGKGASGAYYSLSSAPGPLGATLGDSCGHSGTVAFGRTPATVDWWLINSVTSIVYNTGFDCSNITTLPLAPPGLIQIYPTNELHSPDEHCRIVSPGLAILCFDCSGPPDNLFAADVFSGVVTVAWVGGGSGHVLKTAQHFHPSKFIGNGASGWESTVTVEAANVDACGMVYLANGRLCLQYVLSGAKKLRTSSNLGGSWSATGTGDIGSFSMGGRGQEQAFRVLGGAVLQQCSDNRGLAWGPAYGPAGGATSGGAAGAWMGNQHGIFYKRGSAVFLATSPDLTTWTDNNTGFNGTVCGLARLRSGRLVGLITDSGSFYTLISDDRGRTWTKSAAISITPTTNYSPKILDVNGNLVIAYIQSDAPRFVFSTDGGSTFS